MGLRFDPEKSRILIDTYAEGLLSAFAHDMRLEARAGSGETADDDAIEVRFPVTSLVAVESSKKGKRDYHALDSKDARDVESRVRTQVFDGLDAIRVEARRQGDSAEVFVQAQRKAKARLRLTVRDEDGGVTAEGEGTLSLADLGAGKVHVPMGAMKLKDEVRIQVKVRLIRT